MKEVFLTTIDNPFSPKNDFENWNLFDHEKGYNSSDYLARIARTSDAFTEQEYVEELERAIDEIISNDFRDIYKKIVITD